MLGIEWENFKKLNKQEYIVRKNPKFLTQYNAMIKKNFDTILDLDEIQTFIDTVTQFFEFKYPSQMLDKVGWVSLNDDPELGSCIKLSKLLDIKQLQYRLNQKQRNFLECSYAGMITLSQRRNNSSLMIPDRCVQIDSIGKISEFDLMDLKEAEFLDDIQQIENVEDLYEACQNSTQMIDYQNLERHIYNHKGNISLRNETLNLVMLSLLYANGELPLKGYKRAMSFMRMFNKEYNLALNMEKLDDIMRIDYSDSEEVKRFLKSRK